MGYEQMDTDLFDGARQIETWFWDGDFDHVLGCIDGEEGKWLVEKGILHTEDESSPGVKELIEGDAVYRIRTRESLEKSDDPREQFFTWVTVNPLTGVETPRGF